MDRVVVVGGSLAGWSAAEALRRGGFSGELILVSDEAHLPYDRPPLSKQVLTGSLDVAKLSYYRPARHESYEIDFRLGQGARRLDLERRTVLVGDTELGADALVLATGARPRRLPEGHELDGVHLLRTLDDAQAISAAAVEGGRAVVVGCGFIGAEAASSLAERGMSVSIVEAAPAPLERAVGAEIGRELAGLHPANGVELLLGVGVAGMRGEQGSVTGVELADGRVLDAELVVVGIGVTPATDWLDGSGLTLDDGVVCDASLRAAPGVVAAGDCVRWPHPRYPELGPIRVEHWSNAQEQGQAAAATLLCDAAGEPAAAYEGVPFFWSEQYGHMVQLVGWPPAATAVELVHRGEGAEMVALYRRHDELVGVLGVDKARAVIKSRVRLNQGPLGWDEGRELVNGLI